MKEGNVWKVILIYYLDNFSLKFNIDKWFVEFLAQKKLYDTRTTSALVFIPRDISKLYWKGCSVLPIQLPRTAR